MTIPSWALDPRLIDDAGNVVADSNPESWGGCMGYHHAVLTFKCGKCGNSLLWRSAGSPPNHLMSCSCGAVNCVRLPGKWPNVPKDLWLGPDKHTRFKLYATPPEHANEPWALPYSVRSFVAQATAFYPGCRLHTSARGEVMGETVFRDTCTHAVRSTGPSEHAGEDGSPCHMVTGRTTGTTECSVWSAVARLCQTDGERTFLHHYLGYARDRQFPMLIPQAWMGIADRRRPDFVMFVPLQHWNYKWLAIQLDGAHPAKNAQSDAARDAEIQGHGYEVVSLRPRERGYLEEVRRLMERVSDLMQLADADANKVAIGVEVISTAGPQGAVPILPSPRIVRRSRRL